MALGPPLLVKQVQYDLKNEFSCKYQGEITTYVGSMITINCDINGLSRDKFMQLVLVHKIIKEYKPSEVSASKTIAVARQELMKDIGDGGAAEAHAKIYQSAIEMCMYMMQWIAPLSSIQFVDKLGT